MNYAYYYIYKSWASKAGIAISPPEASFSVYSEKLLKLALIFVKIKIFFFNLTFSNATIYSIAMPSVFLQNFGSEKPL